MEELLDETGNGSNGIARDNQQRAKLAMNAFIGVAIIGAYSTFLQYEQAEMLKGMRNGNLPSIEELEDAEESISRVAFVSATIGITSIILFLMWMRRAYANLNRLGIQTESKDDAAIWSWFIPGYNFFKPVSIIAEIWRKTQKKAKELSSGFKSIDSIGLVAFWWACYLGSIILSFVAAMNNSEAQSTQNIDLLIDTSNYSFYASILNLLAAISLINVIRTINKAEQKIF